MGGYTIWAHAVRQEKTMTRQPKLKHPPSHEESSMLRKSHIWSHVIPVLVLSSSLLVGGTRSVAAQEAKPSPPPESDKQGKTQATPPTGAHSPAPAPALAQGKVRVMTPFGPMDFTAPVQATAGHQSEDGQQPTSVQQPPQPSSPASLGSASSNNHSGPSLPAGQQPPAQP